MGSTKYEQKINSHRSRVSKTNYAKSTSTNTMYGDRVCIKMFQTAETYPMIHVLYLS